MKKKSVLLGMNSDVTVIKPVKSSETRDTEKKDTAVTEEETVKQTETAANPMNETENNEKSTEPAVTEQPSETTSQPESEATDYPGPDTAVLVNLRGDTTTVYKLADGRYMDRINAIYIFDGTDTWYDESGVEWNEAVQTEGAAANVRDPYDLYSWDAETGTYIPYQQAEGTAEPIGRGNGWFYYDAENGNYMPW